MTYEDLEKNPKFKKTIDKVNSKFDGKTSSSEISNPSISNLKIHGGLNIINGPIDLVYAVGQNIKVSKSPIFLKHPFNKVIATVDMRETQLDIPPQKYYSQDAQEIVIDWYIKYKVVDSRKMIQSTQNITKTIQEDCEALISSFIKNLDAKSIANIQEINKSNLEQHFFQNFLNKYGVEITSLKSNNIRITEIEKIKQREIQAQTDRNIRKQNNDLEISMRKENADTYLEIEKKKLEVEKQKLEMYSEAINNSTNADALARMFNPQNNQNLDIYHHDGSIKK